MNNNFLNIICTDLVQAKLLKKEDNLNYLKFILLFLKFKTCRIHTFIRLRPYNSYISFISKIYLNRFFIEIGTNSIIGKYFFLPHPRCIIISNEVQIGEHVHIGQYVTIGGNFSKTKQNLNGTIQKLPIIGNNVNILPGAVIGGPITIGDSVIIGANSVITKDVPSNKIAYGLNQLSKNNIVIPEEGGRYTLK